MKFVYRPDHPKANQNGMVDANLAYQSTNSAPYVIRDEIDALVNHADGKRYTSKRKFRNATKAMGCIEVGTEPIKPRTPIKLDKRQRVDDIRRAIYELRNR